MSKASRTQLGVKTMNYVDCDNSFSALAYPLLSPEQWNGMALDKIESLALLGGLKKVELLIEEDKDTWIESDRTLVNAMWRAVGCLQEYRGEMKGLGGVVFLICGERVDVEGGLDRVLKGVKGVVREEGKRVLRELCGLYGLEEPAESDDND